MIRSVPHGSRCRTVGEDAIHLGRLNAIATSADSRWPGSQVTGKWGERLENPVCLPPCCHTTAEQPACRCCDLLQPALTTGTQSAWRAPAAPCTVLKKLHWSGRFPGDGWMDTTGAEDKPSAKQCQKVSVSRRRPNGPGYKPCRMAEQAVSPPLLGNGPKAGDQPLLAHYRRDVATVSQVPGLLVG